MARCIRAFSGDVPDGGAESGFPATGPRNPGPGRLRDHLRAYGPHDEEPWRGTRAKTHAPSRRSLLLTGPEADRQMPRWCAERRAPCVIGRERFSSVLACRVMARVAVRRSAPSASRRLTPWRACAQRAEMKRTPVALASRAAEPCSLSGACFGKARTDPAAQERTCPDATERSGP